jgi:hypothetical protein
MFLLSKRIKEVDFDISYTPHHAFPSLPGVNIRVVMKYYLVFLYPHCRHGYYYAVVRR